MRQVVSKSGSLQPDSMVDDSSVGGGHAHDEARNMKVLRASLLTQETILRGLTDNMDRRFQAFERRLDKIALKDVLTRLQIGWMPWP